MTLMIFRHLSRSVASCDAPAMSSLVHSFKSWNQVVAGLPLLCLPSIFPCISLFSIPFFRTMWPKNLIFLLVAAERILVTALTSVCRLNCNSGKCGERDPEMLLARGRQREHHLYKAAASLCVCLYPPLFFRHDQKGRNKILHI